MSAIDYLVPSRTYYRVGQSAHNARNMLGVSEKRRINMVDVFSRLEGKAFGTAGILKINLHQKKGNARAFVKFRPLELHIWIRDWQYASLGKGFENFILAHELGHIVMHRNYQQCFSKGLEQKINFIKADESAETQANRFAAQFLAPDSMAIWCSSERDLIQRFGYPNVYAEAKMADMREHSTGVYCPDCGCMSLMIKNHAYECWCGYKRNSLFL